MKLEPHLRDEQFLKIIGARLAQLRLAKNMTQEELAVQSGLGLRTVQRLELGAVATRLSGFVRVCRVLGLLDGLNALLPEPSASPMAQLQLQGRRRKRASGSRAGLVQEAKAKWTWGESS